MPVKTSGGPAGRSAGHNRFFHFVMYTTGSLRYAYRQFVAHVT